MVLNFNRFKKSIIIFVVILISLILLYEKNWLALDSPVKSITNSDEVSTNAASLLEKQKSGFQSLPEYAGINDNSFAEFRLERQRRRGEEIELLREIMKDLDSGSEVKEQISINLMNIINKNETESQTEVLIKSSGIRDCAVIIKDEILSVIVLGELSKEEKGQLERDISNATAFKAEKINIISRKS